MDAYDYLLASDSSSEEEDESHSAEPQPLLRRPAARASAPSVAVVSYGDASVARAPRSSAPHHQHGSEALKEAQRRQALAYLRIRTRHGGSSEDGEGGAELGLYSRTDAPFEAMAPVWDRKMHELLRRGRDAKQRCAAAGMGEGDLGVRKTPKWAGRHGGEERLAFPQRNKAANGKERRSSSNSIFGNGKNLSQVTCDMRSQDDTPAVDEDEFVALFQMKTKTSEEAPGRFASIRGSVRRRFRSRSLAGTSAS